MRAPPQIANCQINSIFHLAKHISEFFSHICEDGWKCSHISHYVLQQMLDFVACKKILNAGYIHPIMASRCQFSSWMEPLDTGPYIRANLETKASCPIDPHFVHPCGRILSHIWKCMRCYVKKKRERNLNWAAYISHRYHLLGFWGKRVQLLQWIISLTTATSVGGGGGTSPRPGIIGLMGVIPVIMLRPGSKPGTQIESVKYTR